MSNVNQSESECDSGSESGRESATSESAVRARCEALLTRAAARGVAMPVLHLQSAAHAAAAAMRAVDAGAAGIWLIDHGEATDASRSTARDAVLRQAVHAVRQVVPPTFFVGVNAVHLVWHPAAAVELGAALRVDGVWLDATFERAPPTRTALLAARARFAGLVFGGVAFKGQREVSAHQDAEAPLFGANDRAALRAAASAARSVVDVVITSGVATGAAPSVAKVRAIASTGAPTALSGAGLDVQRYASAPVHFFLAATALQPLCREHGVVDRCVSSFCDWDDEKLREFVQLCDALTA